MRKKGQAALEFLTTYGWAFLVILVMIGALAYFGVLDPTRFIPQRCQFGQELLCEQFALQDDSNAVTGGDDRVTFNLRNNLPNTFYIDYVQFATDDDPTDWTNCSNTPADDNADYTIAQNQREDVMCEFGDATIVSPGSKERIHLRLIYSQGGTDFEPTYAGTIFGEVYANVN